MFALDAGLDLGGLAGCYVAIGLLAIIITMLEQLDSVLNVSILGFRPFAGVAHAIDNTIIAGLNRAVRFLEAKAAQFESGVITALELLIAIPILVVLGLQKALEYLWSAALKPTIHAITNPIRATASQALALARTAEAAAVGSLAKAETYADHLADRTLASATAYAERQAAGALSAAEKYAAGAVEALRAAETSAIAHAVNLAAEAKAAGDAAAATVLAEARHLVAGAETAAAALAGQTLAEARHLVAVGEADAAALARGAAGAAEAVAAGELAAAEAAGKAALAVVAGVAGAAEAGVLDLEHLIDAAGWAALIASIPALAILVNAIATEAGLGNAACRSKVGNICQTDPLAWGNLLAGLAVLGFAFSLKDLYAVAEGLVGDLSGIIAQAA